MFGLEVHKEPEYYITPHFQLKEFLRSEVMPELAQYEINAIQWLNVRKIAVCLLEPLREQFGGIVITSGGRPAELRSREGKSFSELLREEGYFPSEPSQHDDFSAVDIKLLQRGYYKPAFNWLRRHPAVRQVVMYVDNEGYPRRFHIGIITPYWQAAAPKAFLFTPENKYVAATAQEMSKWVSV